MKFITALLGMFLSLVFFIPMESFADILMEDIEALNEAAQIAAQQVRLDGIEAYNPWGPLNQCIGSSNRLRTKLLAACSNNSQTNLAGWTVWGVRLGRSHASTLLTSRAGRHFLIDPYMFPTIGIVPPFGYLGMIEMKEEYSGSNTWIPVNPYGLNETAMREEFILTIASLFNDLEDVSALRYSLDESAVQPSVIECLEVPPEQPPGTTNIQCIVSDEQQSITGTVVTSVDPNVKLGSKGSAQGQYLSGNQPFRYSVLFENLKTASASAQEIVVTDQLDENLDPNSLSLALITIGEKLITPPTDVSTFTTTVDLRPTNPYLVRIEGDLNSTTGVATWRFTSIDPTTGQPPEDPLAGFLPPNIYPPEGEGSVLFTVRPKAGLPTGTEIRNQADIVFDTNAPITTPEWLNTLDNDSPQSHVLPLASSQPDSSFTVGWSGTDVGAGIQSYTVYMSENGGPFAPWLSSTAETSATFTGQAGNTYAFYSVARDQVGNVEDIPSQPDTATQVRVANRPPVANAGPDQGIDPKIFKGSLVTLNGSGSDLDNGPSPLSFTWEQTGGPAVSLTGATTSSPTFTATDVGQYTFRLTVSDGLASVTDDVKVTVVFEFAGFFPPVDNPPTWNIVKAGSSVPVKFSLKGDQGMAILAASSPSSKQVACDNAAGAGTIEETATAGSSGLNYDPSTGAYNYIWKTSKAWAGSCRQLSVNFIDGASHSAFFKFFK
jgi:hypothetical protein